MVVGSWLKMFLKIFCNYVIYTHDLVAGFFVLFYQWHDFSLQFKVYLETAMYVA